MPFCAPADVSSGQAPLLCYSGLLQVQSSGLVSSQAWSGARGVIAAKHALSTDRNQTEESSSDSDLCHLELITACHAALPGVALPDSVRDLVIRWLQVLILDYDLNDTNSLLSDRTFLVKAVRVLKANALLEGREKCIAADLRALTFLTTFRCFSCCTVIVVQTVF